MLSITVFLILIPYSSWYVVLPLYLEELGATLIDIGLSYALLNVAWYTLQFPGGLLADRHGRKMLIVLPTFTFIVCYVGAGVAWVWSIAALALVMANVFSGLQGPAFTSMIAESVSERYRGTAFAMYEFFINMGFAFGPLIGAACIPHYGYRPLFYVTGVVSGVCGFVRLALLHETVPKSSKGKAKMVFPALSRNLVWFLAGCSLFSLGGGLIMALMPLYAMRRLGLSLVEVELMFSVAPFAMMLASIPAGKLVERFGGMRCLMMAFFGACVSIVAWAYSSSLLGAIMINAISSTFILLNYVAYNSLISDLTVPKTRGAVIGLAGISLGIFTGIGSVMGSYLWEIYDPILPFLISGILGLPSAALLSKIKVPNKSYLE